MAIFCLWVEILCEGFVSNFLHLGHHSGIRALVLAHLEGFMQIELSGWSQILNRRSKGQNIGSQTILQSGLWIIIGNVKIFIWNCKYYMGCLFPYPKYFGVECLKALNRRHPSFRRTSLWDCRGSVSIHFVQIEIHFRWRPNFLWRR